MTSPLFREPNCATLLAAESIVESGLLVRNSSTSSAVNGLVQAIAKGAALLENISNEQKYGHRAPDIARGLVLTWKNHHITLKERYHSTVMHRLETLSFMEHCSGGITSQHIWDDFCLTWLPSLVKAEFDLWLPRLSRYVSDSPRSVELVCGGAAAELASLPIWNRDKEICLLAQKHAWIIAVTHKGDLRDLFCRIASSRLSRQAKTQNDPEDILHEAANNFIRLVPDTLHVDGYRAYFATIVVNRAFDATRAARRAPPMLQLLESAAEQTSLLATSQGRLHLIDLVFRSVPFMDLLKRCLTPRMQQVLQMKYCHGQSTAAIALQLEITEGRVQAITRSIVAQLRKSPYHEELVEILEAYGLRLVGVDRPQQVEEQDRHSEPTQPDAMHNIQEHSSVLNKTA